MRTKDMICNPMAESSERAHNGEGVEKIFDNRIVREWLCTEEAAEYLRLSVGSLRNLTSNGMVPHYKLGNRNRYRLDELRELLLERKKGSVYGL